MSMVPRSIKAAGADGIVRALAPHACAIAGTCVGCFAGWFALIAGLVIGGMLDVARIEFRSRRRVSAFLARPDGDAPAEPLEGYAAAACVALRGDWPGPDDREVRRALFDRFSDAIVPAKARARREAERIVDVAARFTSADLPALARRLATSDAPRARELLADWAFALSAIGGARLDSGHELALRAALGDCGVGAREMLAARRMAFPGERDPWTVLGLSPGAPRAEVKRAYRRLSRLFHPDLSPGDGGESFRELRAAYMALMPPPGP
jgi:DnaJ domain